MIIIAHILGFIAILLVIVLFIMKFRSLFKRQIKSLVRWALSDEIVKMESRLQRNITLHERISREFDNIRNEFKVGVDVDYHGSWAVVCLEGEKHDYIKFLNLNKRDAREISNFLNQFNRKNVRIDTPIQFGNFIKMNNRP